MEGDEVAARDRVSAPWRRCAPRATAGGAHGRCRRRRREVLAGVARAVRTGPRDRHVPGHVVGYRECRLEEAGAGPRQLVADRVGRQNFSDERLRRRPPRVPDRIPANRRRPAVGGLCAGRQNGARALQERSRIGDAVDRRDARLRVVRQPRPGGVRLQRQARLAQGSRRRRQLPRLGGLAAAVQEPNHPVPGF